MARKQIPFSDNPFDALISDAKRPALTQPAQPNPETFISGVRNDPRKTEHSHVKLKESQQSTSQNVGAKFRYGELRKRSSLPKALIKKTFEITPETQAYLNMVGYMRNLYQNVLVQDIFQDYFSRPENRETVSEFKKKYPEEFKQMMTGF